MKKMILNPVKTLIITIIMIFVSFNFAYSQAGTGRNFDFAFGPVANYSGWKAGQTQNNSSTNTISFGPPSGCTGTVQGSWCIYNDPATCFWQGTRCFVLNSNINESDPIVPALKKIPPGYLRSSQINCNENNRNVNMLSYDLLVNDTNCLLTFNYAMVLEAPGHSGYQNPFFQIQVVKLAADGVTEQGLVQPCATFEVIGETPAPQGWGTFSGGIWQDWRQVSMNLTDYLSQRIRIKVILAGCQPTAHWSYGYFVGKVGPSTLSVNACGDGDIVAVITAPSGFQKYEWFPNPGNLPENQLETIAVPDSLLFSSTATATTPANNTFNITSAIYANHGQHYFVKVTSPSSGNTPGCEAYIKVNAQSIKPLTRFSDSVDCQLTAFFDNQTNFPTEGGTKEYYWTFGDGNSAYHSSNDASTNNNISPVHTYENPGTYTVTLRAVYKEVDINNDTITCENEITNDVIIPPTPSFTLKDSTICIGAEITISIQDPAITEGITYTWTNPNAPATHQGESYTASFNQRTEVIVEAASTECTYKDTVIIDVQAFPEITLLGDTMLCLGEQANITAQDATGNAQEMQWSLTNPGNPPQFNPDQPITADPVFTYNPTGDMTIYLIARTSQGCISAKSINIYITNPTAWANKYKVCPGDEVVLHGGQAVEYSWTANPPDATLTAATSTDPVTAHPQETTVYTMKGYGESGCFTEKTVKVTVIPLPEAQIAYSPAYVDVDNPVISLRDASKYGVASHWELSDGTTNDSRSFSHRFNDVSGQNVQIFLTTFNEVNCSDTTSVIIPIELFSVWVPNAFTPDGDGSNDRFFFNSLNKLEDVKFEVYNRWGERVFLYENELLDCSAYTDLTNSLGWDGKKNGKDVIADTYVWRLSYKREGNKKIYDKKGTINIIR